MGDFKLGSTILTQTTVILYSAPPGNVLYVIIYFPNNIGAIFSYIFLIVLYVTNVSLTYNLI